MKPDGSRRRAGRELLAALLAATLVAPLAQAGQTLHALSWADLEAAGQLRNGRVLPDGALALEANGRAETTFPITELADPGISAPVYAIAGEVRCEGVAGRGYLEMWSHFADGGAYFSRTLGRGPVAPLEGSSGWRPFVLPFHNRAGAAPPTRLSLGARLPGGGRVLLRSVRLVQYAAGEDPLRVKEPWWSERQAGRLGGIAGSVIGLLGALVGALAGSGRGRRLAFGALRAMQLVGGFALAAGIAALARAQPYAVVAPLLLLGAIGLGLPLALGPTLQRRYEGPGPRPSEGTGRPAE